jgi:uncharacterized protein
MPTRHRRRPPISHRARRACAMFGLQPEVVGRTIVAGCRAAAAEVDRDLRPGQIALVTGPSGSGKSTILRLLAAHLRESNQRVIVPPSPASLPDAALVDQFDQPLDTTLRLLARAGLADATVFALHPAELSDGQRWRLALAHAVAAGERDHDSTIILDEFASTLDRLTARCISRTLARWVHASGRARAVCATAHDDLLDSLAPSLLVHQPLSASAEFHRAPEAAS